jgi:integrase
MRPNELLSVPTVAVNTSDWFITAGSKTRAGKNRIIPIHEYIRPLISKRLKEAVFRNSEFLFTIDGRFIPYRTYNRHFSKVITDFGFNKQHKPHDCRKHFVTMAKKYSVDEYAIKRIVGHAISDLTESVYTDRDVKWLHKEISKIPTVY